MPKRIRKSSEAEKPALAIPKQQGVRSDANIIADLGLTALVVPPRPAEAERPRPRPRPVPVKRQTANAAWLVGLRRRVERIRSAPHLRPRAHILRVMEPGAAYVVNDIIRALAGVYGGDAIKAQLRFRLPRQGLVERVPVPRGTPHRAPLNHGAPHKDPLTWMYRLTQAGVDERQAVFEHDAAT